MKVILSREAIEDLVTIGERIFDFNPQRASSFIAELQAKCFQLGETPFAFARLVHRENQDIRRRPHGNYLIFYRVRESNVEILHVLHGAQDYQKILFPED